MTTLIAAINTTIDGNYDHRAGISDEELHEHYTNLLNRADVILYGRTTYQLMQYWQSLIEKPSGTKAMDDFAKAIDKVSKIVFSHTLKETNWDSAVIAMKPLEEVVRKLKQQPGKNILVGSLSLISQLMNLKLIDEFQLCIHPVMAGKGLLLFEKITDRTFCKLKTSKTFTNGAIVLYYERGY